MFYIPRLRSPSLKKAARSGKFWTNRRSETVLEESQSTGVRLQRTIILTSSFPAREERIRQHTSWSLARDVEAPLRKEIFDFERDEAVEEELHW